MAVHASSSPENELMLKRCSPQDDLRAHQDLLKQVASNLGLQSEVFKEPSDEFLDIFSLSLAQRHYGTY